MRVVAGEQVQILVGLGDEARGVLEHEGRERHLLGDLLARLPREALQAVVHLRVRLVDLVETHQHLGHPAGSQFHGCELEPREVLEHAVQHEHGHEGLDALVQNGRVAGAHVLAAAHPVARLAAPVVAPLGLQLQRVAADVEHHGHLRLLQQRPQRVVVGVRGRALSRQAVRHPHGTEAVVQAPLHLLKRELGVLQRDRGNADHAVVDGHEVGHVPVVRTGTAVAEAVADLGGRREDHVERVRGEHHLLREAEHVVRDDAVHLVERPECLDLLDLLDHPVAESDEAVLVLVAVAGTLRHDDLDLLVGHDGAAVVDERELLADVRVGELPQEVRQFHDVGVCVVEDAVACVSHVDPPSDVRLTVPTFRCPFHSWPAPVGLPLTCPH